AARTCRSAVDAGEHHVNDVVRVVVLTPGDEDLLSVEPVVISLGRRSCTDQAEIGARLRLGEHHRARPFAAHHPRQVALLLLGGARECESVRGAMRQHGTEFEGEIRGGPDLLHRGGEHLRHRLAAVLRARPELRPAALDELPVRFLETGRRLDASLTPVRALLVAGFVERLEDGLREARRLNEDGRRELLRIIRKALAAGERFGSDEPVHDESDVGEWGAIHGTQLPLQRKADLKARRYAPASAGMMFAAMKSTKWRTRGSAPK